MSKKLNKVLLLYNKDMVIKYHYGKYKILSIIVLA